MDFCIVSALIRPADEKSQMRAPKTSAYFAMQRKPPNKRFSVPKTGMKFSIFVMREAIRLAKRGTTTHSSTKAAILQKVGKFRKFVRMSPNA